MPLSIEWAAGFFEGEGSACVYSKTGHSSKKFQLTLNQINKEPLDVFCNIIEVGKVRGPYGPYKSQLTKQPIYVWKAVGDEAIAACNRLMPYLLSKGKQIEDKMQIFLGYKETCIGSKHPT